MNSHQIRYIEPYEIDSWNEFVDASAAGTLFHTSLWQEVINNSYTDGQFVLIGAFNDSGIQAGFCALARKRLGVDTIVTPLCTPYSGFIVNASLANKEQEEAHTALDALVTFLHKYRYQNLQCAPGTVDQQILTNTGYTFTPRRTLEINLRLPEDELWAGFKSNVRRNIKKAQKAGFDITDQWDSESGFRIFSDTFTRQGQNCPVPHTLFREICEGHVLKDKRRRYCAWKDGKLIGFIVALRHNRRVYYELAASSSEGLKAGISSYLIWELLRDHLDGNWNHFDFVGANNPTITRFKENFNPASKAYWQLEYCSSKRIGYSRGIRRWLKK